MSFAGERRLDGERISAIKQGINPPDSLTSSLDASTNGIIRIDFARYDVRIDVCVGDSWHFSTAILSDPAAPRIFIQRQVDGCCALTISCAARRASVREVVRREGAERPFAASAARLAARDASHSSHVILMTSFSDESATLHLLA